MANLAFQLDAPMINIRVALQRSIDSVGHALRALEEYRPDRDHALPGGIIAALGVSTESHVPGAPIAVQIGPSVPMQLRSALATTWILQKGFSDVITLLSSFVLQQQRLFVALEILKRDGFKVDDVLAATSMESDEAIKFDRRHLPPKLNELRTLAGLNQDASCNDLHERVLSIIRARNCLEHRNGYVGPQDCDDATPDEMRLDWIGPDMTDGKNPVTIKPGQYIETLHVDMRAKRSKVFKRNTIITLSAREYMEVCWTVMSLAESIHLGAVTLMQKDPGLARFLRLTAAAPATAPIDPQP
jgi:hypothetical protein